MKKGVLIVAGISIFAFLFIVGWSSLQRTRNHTGTQVIPSTAAILFESNKDTGERLKEIYTMNRDGGDVTRITFSTRHHFLTGLDPSGRYLVTTCADQDTALPLGLGDEDRRGLWVLDTITGSETRLTELENQAEGQCFPGWSIDRLPYAAQWRDTKRSLQTQVIRREFNPAHLNRGCERM